MWRGRGSLGFGTDDDDLSRTERHFFFGKRVFVLVYFGIVTLSYHQSSLRCEEVGD